jgi:hypothetical protein
MKHYLSILILFSVLLHPVSMHSAPVQMQVEEDFFEDHPEGMTDIKAPGKTILVHTSGKRTAKVIINARKRQAWVLRDKEAALNEPHRKYEYRVNIFLDGEELFVPSSTFHNFYDLNRGKVIITNNEIVLVLDGGDAAEGYEVIINMNQERVIRKRIYHICCDPKYLMEETIYHKVVL